MALKNEIEAVQKEKHQSVRQNQRIEWQNKLEDFKRAKEQSQSKPQSKEQSTIATDQAYL